MADERNSSDTVKVGRDEFNELCVDASKLAALSDILATLACDGDMETLKKHSLGVVLLGVHDQIYALRERLYSVGKPVTAASV